MYSCGAYLCVCARVCVHVCVCGCVCGVGVLIEDGGVGVCERESVGARAWVRMDTCMCVHVCLLCVWVFVVCVGVCVCGWVMRGVRCAVSVVCV